MTISFSFAKNVSPKSEIRAIPVLKEDISGSSGKSLDSSSKKHLKSLGFSAKAGEVQVLSGDSLTMFVGMGSLKDLSASGFRKAASAMTKAAGRNSQIFCRLLDCVSRQNKPALSAADATQALAEGAVMGTYSYGSFKSGHEAPSLKKVILVKTETPQLKKAVAKGRKIAEAVCLAKDLINEPGGSLTPTKFASRASSVARKSGLTAKVWNKTAIQKGRMGGLLGVNRGSEQDPRFVELSWKPRGTAKGHLALVGKGITFDSGGLSIKTAVGMSTMKYDMAGAAAVLAAMSLVSFLKPAIKVSAYIPMTDNMTGGDATRPGDVLTIRNKKTVEVLNTDAEGRLILADALSLASENSPDAIVDLATLTGACVVALGEDYAGLMSNNDSWSGQILKASEKTGEKVWQLPLEEDYKSQLESSVADLKNIGANYGGTITAALFLSEFVGKADKAGKDGRPIAWAHLDIAGPAYDESTEKGGTGYGVRLLADLIANFKKPAKS